MVDRVLFQMWGPFRDGLIASHRFYVSEARTRLLSQFGTMKEDADRYADDWLASRAPYFNPDRDDPADAYEQAWDESVSFYLQLEDLQKATRLSVIAGMYHEWEKQLRDWVTRELGRVIHGSHTRAALWKATIDQLLDFLECWGWPVRSRPYFQRLHQCHLVVNVYKHGEGISFEKLHKDAPQFLKRDDFPEPLLRFPPDYTNLTVTDDDLDQFSDAIVAFWQDVPENTFASQIGDLPKWLKNAIEKDQPPA